MSDHGWARYWSNGPEQVAAALAEPNPPAGPVRTQAEMTDEEIAALERLYGCKVSREPPRESDA